MTVSASYEQSFSATHIHTVAHLDNCVTTVFLLYISDQLLEAVPCQKGSECVMH